MGHLQDEPQPALVRVLESAGLSQQEGIRVLQVGGSVVVDVARFRFYDLAGAPVRTADLATLLEDVLEGVPELPSEPEQEHGYLTAQDRQLKLPQQVSQPTGRQTEAFVEEGRGLCRGPAEPIVKQSRGFGPAARVRLETDRDPTHLGTRYHIRVEHQRGGTLVSGSVSSLVEKNDKGARMRKEEDDGTSDGESENVYVNVRQRLKAKGRMHVCARMRAKKAETEGVGKRKNKRKKKISFRPSRV